jgi:hypothetical protein
VLLPDGDTIFTPIFAVLEILAGLPKTGVHITEENRIAKVKKTVITKPFGTSHWQCLDYLV